MESKVEEEIVGINVLSNLIEYIESKEFKSSIELFKSKFADDFVELSESKTPDLIEQSIEFTEIFMKFEKLLDGLFDEFAQKNKVDVQIIYQNCLSAIEGDFIPLFE